MVNAIDPLIDSKALELNSSGSLYARVKSMATVAKSAYRLRKEIGSFYDLMTAPASKLLDQFFESEPLKVSENRAFIFEILYTNFTLRQH